MRKELIEFSEFLEIVKKLEITYGQVVSVERVPKSKKLLKLIVIFGIEESDEKTVVTNLGDKFEPEDFEGLTFPFITNLKPSVMMGITSEAMIMVPTNHNVVELEEYSLGAKLL